MGDVVSLNNRRKEKEEEKPVQVYKCNADDCGRQDWRIHDTFALVCNGCDIPSTASWYVPEIRTCEAEFRLPRKKMLRTVKKEGYVCGYCSNITFHMQSDGRLTCFRCKKEAAIRFFFPEVG